MNINILNLNIYMYPIVVIILKKVSKSNFSIFEVHNVNIYIKALIKFFFKQSIFQNDDS